MNILAFALCLLGIFLLYDVRENKNVVHKERNLKSKIKAVNTKQQNNFLANAIRQTARIVEIESIPGGMVTVWSISAAGASVGLLLCVVIQNLYLAPVLMAALSALPFLIIMLRWQKKEKQMNESLAVALSGITNSYLRGNNTIVRAVEENMPHLNGGVAQVFRRFLVQTSMVDSNTEDALRQMKEIVHNVIFSRWVDAVIRCLQDHNLKTTLPLILDKFSDLRAIESETKLITQQPRQTFFIMLGAAIFSPFLLYFLNAEWWNIIAVQAAGKILVAIHIGAIVAALAIGLSAMKPIGAEKEETK